MEKQLTYPDGSPILDGDWVQIERGATLGRVTKVIDNQERASSQGLKSLGVIVDAQPKGFVFLSETLLHEDQVRFVRRGPSEETRDYVALALGLAALFVLPALYSFFSAIYSAATTGEVLVISLGRTETYRAMVSWDMGWARFVGPIVLCASLSAFDSSRGVSIRWWMSGACAVIGLTLLSFSFWFSSLDRAFIVLGLIAIISVAAAVSKWSGRTLTLIFLAGVAAFVVWQITRAV